MCDFYDDYDFGVGDAQARARQLPPIPKRKPKRQVVAAADVLVAALGSYAVELKTPRYGKDLQFVTGGDLRAVYIKRISLGDQPLLPPEGVYASVFERSTALTLDVLPMHSLVVELSNRANEARWCGVYLVGDVEQ